MQNFRVPSHVLPMPLASLLVADRAGSDSGACSSSDVSKIGARKAREHKDQTFKGFPVRRSNLRLFISD